MATVRLALVFGGAMGAAVVGACGLESGGPSEDPDSGGDPDVIMADGSDVFMLPDAPMDIMTPDLGTGETESGVACTCTPLVPGGWTLVSYVQKSRPPCPTGYNMPANLVENPTAASSTCSCQCGGGLQTPPSCAGNVSFSVQFDSSNVCGGTTGTIVCGVSCTNGNWAFSPNGNGLNWMKASASPPSPAGGTCAAPTVNTKTFPIKSSDSGRACKLAAAPGNCMSGLCVPTPMAPDGICIAQAGVSTCPMGFPNTHFVGDTVTDNRDCGPNPCSCSVNNVGTCSTPSLSLYDKTSCNSNDLQVTAQAADGVCQNINLGNSKTFLSAKYTSSPSGATCAFSGTFNPTGGLGVSNVQTICCL